MPENIVANLILASGLDQFLLHVHIPASEESNGPYFIFK